MTVINSNINALYAQGSLKVSQIDGQTAMQQLSSGKRVNSSKDDAAGLALANRMTQSIQSLNQAVRNAGDAISFIQTADGATNSITAMLQRMNELAVQASTSTYSTEQRSFLDQEFQQLKQEISRTSSTQEWNGFPILSGKGGTPVGTPTITTAGRAVVGATSIGKSLDEGDLQIVNASGQPINIPSSLASSDTVSSSAASSSSKSGSAIAIAAAINSQTASTGVVATANSAIINGSLTSIGSSSIVTDLYINGTPIPMSLTPGQSAVQRRAYVINAVNAGTNIHGVKAADPGNGGISLTTVDGRNLSVWYDASAVKGSDFGLGIESTDSDASGVTGLPSASTASASASQSAALTFNGLTAGNSVSVNGLTFTAKGIVTPTQVAAAFSNLTSGLTAAEASFNNIKSTALGSYSGTFSEGFTTGANSSASLTITATADNQGVIPLALTPKLVTTQTPAIVTTKDFNGTKTESSVITFNNLAAGQAVTLNGLTYTATVNNSPAQVAAAFANLISGASAETVSSNNPTSSALGTYSGAFTMGFNTAAVSGDTITATSTAPTEPVADIVASTSVPSVLTKAGLNVPVSTVYGTVTLNSKTSFTLQPGANAFASDGKTPDPSYTNFADLGFVSGIVNPQNIGRFTFQIGASADQQISIDLPDFGKDGNITGVVTSDQAATNILTTAASSNVIQQVNTALNQVSNARAIMGAVTDRLQDVIDNLTNVSTNESASRSQILDTDYAAASTALARSQIMQQAATAVLAQANTDMQTVMKLLQ